MANNYWQVRLQDTIYKKSEKETQIKKIFEELSHFRIELINNNGLYNFYIKNKEGKTVSLLRSFHDNNFIPASEFYSTVEDKIGKIRSDYIYVSNLRLDC